MVVYMKKKIMEVKNSADALSYLCIWLAYAGDNEFDSVERDQVLDSIQSWIKEHKMDLNDDGKINRQDTITSYNNALRSIKEHNKAEMVENIKKICLYLRIVLKEDKNRIDSLLFSLAYIITISGNPSSDEKNNFELASQFLHGQLTTTDLI
tara:strand:- start:3400 stop:3855 length:456 start_codon:yes stop_codon:yes gene_type:complete